LLASLSLCLLVNLVRKKGLINGVMELRRDEFGKIYRGKREKESQRHICPYCVSSGVKKERKIEKWNLT
jgi:hypothetical protein